MMIVQSWKGLSIWSWIAASSIWFYSWSTYIKSSTSMIVFTNFFSQGQRRAWRHLHLHNTGPNCGFHFDNFVLYVCCHNGKSAPSENSLILYTILIGPHNVSHILFPRRIFPLHTASALVDLQFWKPDHVLRKRIWNLSLLNQVDIFSERWDNPFAVRKRLVQFQFEIQKVDDGDHVPHATLRSSVHRKIHASNSHYFHGGELL